jgi:alginate O-acetyltransferase complex protein AlgI
LGFNSYPFILLFLPVAVLLHRLALAWGARARQAVLLGAGLVFYALAGMAALPVLAGSVLGNYACARVLAGAGEARRAWVLRIGVMANLAALGLFKYSGWIAGMAWPALGARLEHSLILPLGLSFFTFQQIGFLVDVARGRCPVPPLLTHAATIVFFPIMLSGPVTYVRELVPQFAAIPPRDTRRADLLVGSSLFAVGLFKKTVLADTMALWVDPLFDAVDKGGHPASLQAWMMLAGYLLQMYFDFSGYSDMAMGAARMLGVRIPLNFFSPLRSTSVIDWWRRWHASLGRFVNDYIFQSLALPLTRWAMARGASRRMLHAAGVLLPTAIAMLVIGAWHGGRWTYVVFGLLHATFMVVAELWRFWRHKRPALLPPKVWAVFANALTMVCVLVALAPFRAGSMGAAVRIWAAMTGLVHAGVAWPFPGAVLVPVAAAEIVAGLLFAHLLPNSIELFRHWQPVLPTPLLPAKGKPSTRLAWRPSLGWALALGVVFAAGLAFVSRGGGQFVYFAF